MVTTVPVGTGFEVDHLRVAVQSAQWVRQPPPTEPITARGAEINATTGPDRLYLELTLENVAVSPLNVGRAEFRVAAANGASWAPLADDFPDIVLAPAEKLTTRLVFEVPPQSARLDLVSTAGAGEVRLPIGDDSVGGLFGALCRAWSKPWNG